MSLETQQIYFFAP